MEYLVRQAMKTNDLETGAGAMGTSGTWVSSRLGSGRTPLNALEVRTADYRHFPADCSHPVSPVWGAEQSTLVPSLWLSSELLKPRLEVQYLELTLVLRSLVLQPCTTLVKCTFCWGSAYVLGSFPSLPSGFLLAHLVSCRARYSLGSLLWLLVEVLVELLRLLIGEWRRKTNWVTGVSQLVFPPQGQI